MKGSVQSSVWAPEFDMKHLKKAKGHTSTETCEYNNEDNRLNTLNDKNYQALSQKFREMLLILSLFLS